MQCRRNPLLVLAAGSLLASCGGNSPTGTDTHIATSVAITGGFGFLDAIGATAQLSAVVQDQHGTPMSATVAWASGNQDVATVSSSGLVTAVGPGVARITASAGTASARTDETVTQAPATATKISGDAQTGVAGTQLAQPLVVQLFDRLGHPVQQSGAFFAVTQGGGSVGTPQASTDAAGHLTTTWTLGAATGQQTVILKYTPTGSAVVTFTATATSGTP